MLNEWKLELEKVGNDISSHSVAFSIDYFKNNETKFCKLFVNANET